MEIRQARAFLARLSATREDELSCDDLEAVIARYCEAVAESGDLGGFGRRLPEHLFQCPECSDVASTVAYLAALDADERLPTAGALWADLRSGLEQDRGLRTSVSMPERSAGTGRIVPSSFAARSTRLLPLLLTAGAMVAAIGWIQADSRARDSDRVVEALGDAVTMQSVPVVGEGHASLFFDPGARRAVMHVASPILVGDDLELQGQLLRSDGTTGAIRFRPCARSHHGWWFLESETPLAAFDVLAVNDAPSGDAIAELHLLTAASR